jgi:hypothetical protein
LVDKPNPAGLEILRLAIGTSKLARMTAVRNVHVQLARPSKASPDGRVTEGFYIIDGETLVMTKPNGGPVDETRFRHRLGPNDDPEAIARVLTKRIRLEKLGMTEDQASFRRPLEYSRGGVA